MNTQEAIDILNTLLDKNRFTDGVEISSLTHAIEHMKRGAPEGWQLVPKEPNYEMKNAGIDIDSYKLGDISPLGFRFSPQELMNRIYKAMLSVAPEPPQERKD
jgi:hypothetical protein